MGRSSREILERVKTIAVVGASRDPDKAGGSEPSDPPALVRGVTISGP